MEVSRDPGSIRGQASTTAPLAQPRKGHQGHGEGSNPGKGPEELGPAALWLPQPSVLCSAGQLRGFCSTSPSRCLLPRTRLAGLAPSATTGSCSHVSSISVHHKAPAPRDRAARGRLCFEIKTFSRLPRAKTSWKVGPQQPPNLKAPGGMVPHPKVSRCLGQAGDFSEPAAQDDQG